MVFVMMMD
jgi:hypothetical protein